MLHSVSSSSQVVLATEVMSQAQYPLEISDEVPDFTLDSQLGSIYFHYFIDGRKGPIASGETALYRSVAMEMTS